LAGMKILVLNCGSSSIKYQLIDPTTKKALAKGSVERIGMSGSILTHKAYDRDPIKVSGEIIDHIVGVEYVISILLSKNHGVIENKDEIDAVGHRVVHGGETFSESVLIDDEVIKEIRQCIEYAPLHNPHNLRGINACLKLLPGIPQVAVFDTAFHQMMPDYAFIYGIPYVLYKRYGIRRYGFHGPSHYYVSSRTADLMERPINELKIITCHLGNGCSVAAIEEGASVDTSMGFTPLEGLVMGSRSGDLDPAVILHLLSREELSLHEGITLLNKHSGLLGISGISSDVRDLEQEYHENNKQAQLAINIFCYRLRKYIGSYAAVMGGLDAITFTAGIGENSELIRRLTLEKMEYLGIKLDSQLNEAKSQKERLISSEDSKVKVYVVPTNEELVIAQETLSLIKKDEKQEASE